MDSSIPELVSSGTGASRSASRGPAGARAGADGRAPEPVRYNGLIAKDRVDPDAAKVVKRLTRAGHQAYLVGGGVRDLLLGQKPKDFDIATSARPHEVRALFRNCRVIGRRFRLAHVLFSGGKIIEVATFRRDPRDGDAPPVSTVEDGEGVRLVPGVRNVDEDTDLLIRHDNAFGEPHEDALRRDFTINGLFYDLERDEVIDYVGGVRDVRARVVRTIGDPAIRFREDPIRILRAIKFCARLDLGLDAELYDALIDQRQTVGRASPPRTFEEILRLLRGGAAHRSFYLLWDSGLLSLLIPELSSYLDDVREGGALVWRRLSAVDRLVAQQQLPSDAILLSALLQSPAEEYMEGERDPALAFDAFAEEMALRFTVPRRIRERMRLLLAVQKRLRDGKLGNVARREFFGDAALLYGLDCEARGAPVPAWAFDISRYEESGGHKQGAKKGKGKRP